MKFVEENKLLFSIILALFMIGVVVTVFFTARMSPAMTKFTNKPFYDIPKAKSPNPSLTADASFKNSQTTFIDPIVAERAKEARGGIPLPADITDTPGRIPGVTDKTAKIVPMIPGYGPAPESPYDKLYDPDSPFKFSGRPGRLGNKVAELMKAAKEEEKTQSRKSEVDEPTDYRGVPSKPDTKARPMELRELNAAFRTLLQILATASDASKTEPQKPVEGKPDKDISTKDKKDSAKKSEDKKKAK